MTQVRPDASRELIFSSETVQRNTAKRFAAPGDTLGDAFTFLTGTVLKGTDAEIGFKPLQLTNLKGKAEEAKGRTSNLAIRILSDQPANLGNHSRRSFHKPR